MCCRAPESNYKLYGVPLSAAKMRLPSLPRLLLAFRPLSANLCGGPYCGQLPQLSWHAFSHMASGGGEGSSPKAGEPLDKVSPHPPSPCILHASRLLPRARCCAAQWPRHTRSRAAAQAALRKGFNEAAHENDLQAALDLYASAKAQGAPLTEYMYGLLLNLCATAATGEAAPVTANAPKRRKGVVRTPASMLAATAAAPGGGPTFLRKAADCSLTHEQLTAVTQEVVAAAQAAPGVALKESAYSSAIRAMCGVGKPHTALQYLDSMAARQVAARGRTFLPVLQALAAAGDADTARAVLQRMLAAGVTVTEQAYAAMLRAITARLQAGAAGAAPSTASDADWWAYAETLLAELAGAVHRVSRDTAAAVVSLFELHESTGGGRRWLSGEGAVNRSGVFEPSGTSLASLDVQPGELAHLAQQAEQLACKGERRTAQFAAFKEFLGSIGPVDILVDAANVGFYNQNYVGGAFSHAQIDAVVTHFASKGLKVLVVLHGKWFQPTTNTAPFKRASNGAQKRRHDGSLPAPAPAPPAAAAGSGVGSAPSTAPADTSSGTSEVERLAAYRDRWRSIGSLFEVQRGNNDDWYWLYAAVTCVGSDGTRGSVRVVSNDQMRDHHFRMLAPTSFLKWRERHQITYYICLHEQGDAASEEAAPSTVSLRFRPPPPYSARMQGGQHGWFMPLVEEAGERWVATWPAEQ